MINSTQLEWNSLLYWSSFFSIFYTQLSRGHPSLHLRQPWRLLPTISTLTSLLSTIFKFLNDMVEIHQPDEHFCPKTKPNQISFQVKPSAKFCLFVTPSQPSGSDSAIYSFGQLFKSLPLGGRARWHPHTLGYLPRLFCWGSFPAVSSLPAAGPSSSPQPNHTIPIIH